MRRRNFLGLLGAAGIAGGLAGLNELRQSEANGWADSPFERGDVKNVIVLVGDGMGFDHIEVTEEVHGRLALQEFAHTGYTQTDSRSGEVTDSAAAGTALATGIMVYNGQVSVFGEEGTDDGVELTTQLEVAERLGMETGLVSTTRVTYATPAVYASHVGDRDEESEIVSQMIASGAEVMMGGGRSEWSDDQLTTAEENGYELLYEASDLEDASGDRLLGLFADSHIAYTLDRDDSTPGLLDMTETAVDRLEDGDEGFFLMVEGGRIDHAAHVNDIATTVAETKEFDDVVAFAREYAAEHEDTLVIVASDHETGGLATGDSHGSPIETGKIANAEASNLRIAVEIEEGADVADAVAEYAHVELDDEEISHLESQADESFDRLLVALGEVLSDRLGVDWTTQEHTGPAQVLMATGPGEERFLGWHHHVDVSRETTALLLFGERERATKVVNDDELRRRVTGDAPVRDRDAYTVLTNYVGPVEDDLTAALDTNGDGVVDYGDVLTLLGVDEDAESAEIPLAVGRISRREP
ncbi:alkaline phosphatase [Haloprofundus halobius]|uniref:alkaline phosphatase n=1 Tax=Haloprofundus halobius TaxID=2876194 RepID=UPI001CCE75DF|nr:alkaline phosphatase [Haloprofundus halobius]